MIQTHAITAVLAPYIDCDGRVQSRFQLELEAAGRDNCTATMHEHYCNETIQVYGYIETALHCGMLKPRYSL